MKQCISRISKLLIHLWRTLKKYVRKRIKVRDFTGDGKVDLLITNDPKWIDSCEVNTLNENMKIEENIHRKENNDYDK